MDVERIVAGLDSAAKTYARLIEASDTGRLDGSSLAASAGLAWAMNGHLFAEAAAALRARLNEGQG